MENIINPPIQTTVNTKRLKINYLFSVFIAALFIVFITGVYYLGRQSLRTSTNTSIINLKNTIDDWKKYTNQVYGFSLKYPSNFVYSNSGPNSFQQQLNKGQQISGTVAPSFDTITFTNNRQKFSLGIFHQQSNLPDGGFDGSCGSQFADSTQLDQMKNLNILQYREIQQKTGDQNIVQYCFLNNSQNLLVLSSTVDSRSLLDQVLATFEFNGNFSQIHDTSVSSSSSDIWKTYTNSTYGFSVDYPTQANPIILKNNSGLDFIDFRLPDTISWITIDVQKTTLVKAVANIKSQALGRLPVKVVSEENTILNDNKITKLYFESTSPANDGTPGSSYANALISHNGYVYIIESESSLLNQVLSTFKFTESNTGTPDVSKAITSSMSVYSDNYVTFKYPSNFISSPLLTHGSGYTQEFVNSKFILSFTVKGNYNQETGNPFTDIDNYVGVPYQASVVNVNGQNGRQYLPRAGSENINEVAFLSKDQKNIFVLNLQVGNNPDTVSVSDIDQGQKYFSQILSTFKYVSQTQVTQSNLNWQTFRDTNLGIQFKYPLFPGDKAIEAYPQGCFDGIYPCTSGPQYYDVSVVNPNFCGHGGCSNFIRVSIFIDPKSSRFNDEKQPYNKDYKYIDSFLAGQKALELVHADGTKPTENIGVNSPRFVVTTDKYGYVVQTGSPTDPVVKSIVDSFRFL